jgi:hypothetical protein
LLQVAASELLFEISLVVARELVEYLLLKASDVRESAGTR